LISLMFWWFKWHCNNFFCGKNFKSNHPCVYLARQNTEKLSRLSLVTIRSNIKNACFSRWNFLWLFFQKSKPLFGCVCIISRVNNIIDCVIVYIVLLFENQVACIIRPLPMAHPWNLSIFVEQPIWMDYSTQGRKKLLFDHVDH
jgi:hypothetical protein